MGVRLEKKFIVARKSEANESENSVIGWASKPTIDRDRELILADAWKLDGYKKNPVVVLAHNYSELPIGKCLWIKSTDQGLKFKAKFANTERGKEVYQLYEDGILNCFSVGFAPRPGGVVDNPTDVKYKGVKRLFTNVELLEISCVPIPSNQDAIIDQGSFVKYVREGKIITKELKTELEGIVEIIEKGTDEFELEIEVKGVSDISVEDICCAIEMELNKDRKDGDITVDNPSCWITKLFPVDYPSGYAIFEEYTGRPTYKHYKVDYAYDADTKIVILTNKIEVMQDWVPAGEMKSFVFDRPEELVVKVETTENYVHVPAIGEEGKHKDHKIRTMELSKKEGIKGKYCVDDKKMISYMFSTDKDWDEEKAKKWVEDHAKSLDVESDSEDKVVFKGMSVDEDGDILFQATKSSLMPDDEEEMEVFMDRCMSDKDMMGENEDEEERREACKMRWDEKKGKKDDNPTEIKAEDDIDKFTTAISLLKEEIESLKKRMSSSAIEPSNTELIITKTTDAEGNPSLYDLTSAVNMALNGHYGGINGGKIATGCCNVIDLYTPEFPSGHVVYCAYEQEGPCYYRVDYTYDMQERKAVISGDPVEVLQSWIEDKYGEQDGDEMKSSTKEDILTKEGRVLSEANRQMMSECISQLTEAIQALKDLVVATDKTPKVAQTVADLFKDISPDEIEFEDTLETKSADVTIDLEEDNDMLEIDEDVLRSAIESALSKALKIDVKGTVTETVARMKGRVVA